MSKIIAAAAAAAGYVLGTKAGREQYVQIKAKAQQVWGDPRVQEKKTQATGMMKAKASQARERVPGQGSAAAKDATDTTTTPTPIGTPTPTGTGGGIQGVPMSSRPDDAPPLVNPPTGPTQ
jgi:SLT domain-containing protein